MTVQGSATARITDFGTFRLRGGWAAGPFLPYGFVAFALGRADVARSATVQYVRTDFPDQGTVPLPPTTFGPVTETDGRRGAFAYGAAAGLGVDVALLSNVFLRVGMGAIRSAQRRPYPHQHRAHRARTEVLIAGERADDGRPIKQAFAGVRPLCCPADF